MLLIGLIVWAGVIALVWAMAIVAARADGALERATARDYFAMTRSSFSLPRSTSSSSSGGFSGTSRRSGRES